MAAHRGTLRARRGVSGAETERGVRCASAPLDATLTRAARTAHHARGRQRNFGKPVEWGLVKQYPVRKLAGGSLRARRRMTLTRE